MPALEGIYHQVGMFHLGVCQAESAGPGGGYQLYGNVVVGQIDAVVIRFGDLGLVGEPAGALVLFVERAGGDGHDAESAVVVDPGRGLVRLLDAADVCGVVAVGPAVAVAARLRRPEMGAPGGGDGRIGVTGREVVGGKGAGQGIHIAGPVYFLGLLGKLRTGRCQQSSDQNGY